MVVIVNIEYDRLFVTAEVTDVIDISTTEATSYISSPSDMHNAPDTSTSPDISFTSESVAENNDLTDGIYVLKVIPRFGPYAGGTNITVTLACVRGCGNVTLNIGNTSCLEIHNEPYVIYDIHK